MTPEGLVKKQVDAVLKAAGAYYLKPVQNGMGAPALDYHGCHRGFAFVVEAKRPGARPTPRQTATASQVAAAGGSIFLVDGWDSLMRLQNWLEFPVRGFSSWRYPECETDENQ